jgi:hypothetical protein
MNRMVSSYETRKESVANRLCEVSVLGLRETAKERSIPMRQAADLPEIQTNTLQLLV